MARTIARAAAEQPVEVSAGPVTLQGNLGIPQGALGKTPDGKNPPLVLLHGGGSTIDTTFGKILPALAKSRQLIAFEQQGHGRTADIPNRPFSFEQSADDAAALLRHLEIEQADWFGFSNGGHIAMQVAIRHPKVVRKLWSPRPGSNAMGIIRSSGTS